MCVSCGRAACNRSEIVVFYRPSCERLKRIKRKCLGQIRWGWSDRSRIGKNSGKSENPIAWILTVHTVTFSTDTFNTDSSNSIWGFLERAAHRREKEILQSASLRCCTYTAVSLKTYSFSYFWTKQCLTYRCFKHNSVSSFKNPV